MNNKDTFDILHSEFDDCPKMPDSLNKRNIVAKLKTIPQVKNTAINFRHLGTMAAAMVAVIVCAIVGTSGLLDNVNIENQLVEDAVSTLPTTQVTLPLMNEVLSDEAKLSQVNSRDKVVEWFRDNYKENGRYNLGLYGDVVYDSAVDMDNMSPTSAGAPLAGTTAESMNSASDLKGHAETNTQVKGVDEGDIIKTDSRYIYFLGSDSGARNRKLRIIDTKTMEAVFDSYIYDENGDILWVSDIYVKDDTLVTLCSRSNSYDMYSSRAFSYYGANDTTIAMSFDITNRSQPKLIRSNTQDGSYRSSRMVGNTLYTVSQYYVRAESEEELENVCIPKVGGAEIGCDCIFLPEKSGDSYILLTGFDVTDENAEVRSVAVLGNTGNYYCSEDTFYVVAEDYNYKDSNPEIREKTIINSFKLDSVKILFKATGEVKGRIINQYSLDEYEGKLRIATTSYNNRTNKNVSSLYVLDENLDTIGKLEDIANNEQIKSVRYMGDEAYIVTFRNTDPLFAIDLSDPKAPAIKGELKIPGYSAYLHPIGNNLLVGIGYEGDSQNADFNSVKVSLFDISDPKNLKELDKLVYLKASTPIINEPKAFLYKADEGIIGMPVNSYEDKGEENLYYIIQVKDNTLTLKHELLHSAGYYKGFNNLRGTYVDDKFFTVSDYIVKKYDFISGEFIGEVTFADIQTLVPTTAAAENKDIYKVEPGGAVETTVGTSQGYTVDEPVTKDDIGVMGQTTPPYNPDNPDEVIEMPTE